MTTATDRAVALLQCAYGITYTPDEARKIILDLAEAIRVEQGKRPRHNLTDEQLDNLAWRYIAGASSRSLAKEMGYKDHKAFSARLRPAVEAIGGTWRGQAQSQETRRAMDRLRKDDVMDWGSHELFRSGR